MINMIKMIEGYLNDGRVIGDWQCHYELWLDDKKAKSQFIVIQSNGGTAVNKDLGGDFYFSIYVIGKVGRENLDVVQNKAMSIIEYVKNNPINNCIGTIHMQAPLGRPTLTEENRVVYELLVRVVR